MTVANPN